jgi:hypothetical protein
VGAGNQEKENTMSNQPAHKIQRGVLKITIWRNKSEKGTFYTADLTRGYKNHEDIWAETNSLGHDDFLPAMKLWDLADTWVMHAKQADAKARKEQANQPTAK